TILQCLSAKTTSWNEFSSTMASIIIYLATNQKFNFSRYILLSLVKNIEAGVPFFMFSRFVKLLIDHQLGDMSHHKDIYDNPSLTKKVFSNMKKVGTGFSGVVTPLFDNMLVPVAKEVGIIQDDVQFISIHTEPSTFKPHKKHKSKKHQTQAPKVPSPEPSPEHRLPSPSNDLLPSGKDILKLKELTDLCTHLSNKVLELESEVIDIKSTYKERIEKLEGRVDRLEEENRERIIANIDEDVEINLEEAQAKPYKMDLEHQEKVFSMHDVDDEEPAEVEEVLEVVTAAKLITEVVTTAGATTTTKAKKVSVPRRRNGVVIQDPEETTSIVIVHSETEAQARKNMIIYLKNMAGYKMNYFKGMNYSEIKPLFKKNYNYNQAFLEEVNEEVTVPEKEFEVESHKREGKSLEKEIIKKQKMDVEAEELKSYLQIVFNDDDDVYTKATPLASKIPIVDYKIHFERNKPYFKIIRVDGNHMLFLSFSTLLKNFNREDLESPWKLVKERFEKTKPKNYSYDYLLKLSRQCLNNLMLKPVYGEIKRRYLLTHLTLEHMMSNVRLEVEEESEMSLELLRLSHLNFDYINLLLKKDVVIGLPKLKYVKDQLCSSCEVSKAKRSPFKKKTVPGSKGRLNLLHMDVCGPMWVASINRKKYILVVSNDDDDVYTEATPLASKIPIVDYKIHFERNKPCFKIIRADERKNYTDDYLLKTLKTMLISLASVWRDQKGRYPLTHFTLEQMLNNVRLEVEEESKMSLELLSLISPDENMSLPFRRKTLKKLQAKPLAKYHGLSVHSFWLTFVQQLWEQLAEEHLLFMRVVACLLMTKFLLLRVNTPRCDEDRLELMELTVFLLPSDEKVRVEVSVVDLQVSAFTLIFLFSIKYALTVNLNIYVSSIKQFWTTVVVKKVNDCTRLQALVDKKKMVVMEATIRDALRLDDAKGKGFSGVETPLFEGMFVAQEVEEGDADENNHLFHPPPQLSHDIPSTSQVQPTPPQSPQGRMIADMDAYADVVLEEAKDVADDAKDGQDEEESEPAELQEVVDIFTTAKIITKVVTAASPTITIADVPIPAATTAAALTLTAAPSRRTIEVVIKDPEESTNTTSTIIQSEIKSKDKGKGILVEEPKPLKKQAQIKQDEKYARELEVELNRNIDWDEVIDHVNKKDKEDHAVKRALKRINETLTEKAAKRQKLDEEVEELKRHLQIVPNKEDDVYTEATPLARKVPVVDYEIINQNNKPYYKIKRADGSYQLYLSFLSLLRN
nr:retrovirus-related Pol polyprotein from transposon TNT 1-94 [Tanacetum cinerariifolium]